MTIHVWVRHMIHMSKKQFITEHLTNIIHFQLNLSSEDLRQIHCSFHHGSGVF